MWKWQLGIIEPDHHSQGSRRANTNDLGLLAGTTEEDTTGISSKATSPASNTIDDDQPTMTMSGGGGGYNGQQEVLDGESMGMSQGGGGTSSSVGTGAGGNGNASSSSSGGGTSSSSSFAALPFPPLSGTPSHYPSSLSSLGEETSPYPAVARTCLQLSQFASSGCSTTTYGSYAEDGRAGEGWSGSAAVQAERSCLVHENTFCVQVSEALARLADCSRNHRNRKCRMAALRCTALLARSAFARLRQDANVQSASRAPPSSIAARLEDECAADVPTGLAEAALKDEDDIVAAAAYEALGLLCLDSSNDGLTAEINQIGFGHNPPPRRISRRRGNGGGGGGNIDGRGGCSWEDDGNTYVLELQHRILSNILPPRIRRLVQRALILRPSSTLQLRCVPLLTWALGSLYRTVPSSNPGNSLVTMNNGEWYAKRWYDLDLRGLVDEFVRRLLIAGMVNSHDGRFTVACALSVLRLTDACEGSSVGSWADEGTYRLVTDVLFQSLSTSTQHTQDAIAEAHAGALAATLVACRAMIRCTGCLTQPALNLLLATLREVVSMPPSVPAPPSSAMSVTRLGRRSSSHGSSSHGHHRRGGEDELPPWPTLAVRPVRVGLLTECASLLLVDGAAVVRSYPTERSDALRIILGKQEAVYVALKHRYEFSRGRSELVSDEPFAPHVGEEIVTAFCTVMFEMGCRLTPGGGGFDGKRSSPSSSATTAQQQTNNSSTGSTGGGGEAGKGVLVTQQDNVQEWLRCALQLLQAFGPCLTWPRNPVPAALMSPPPPAEVVEGKGKKRNQRRRNNHKFATDEAAAESYLALYTQCLCSVGLLDVSAVVVANESFETLHAPNLHGGTIGTTTTTSFKSDLSRFSDHMLHHNLRERGRIKSLAIRLKVLSILASSWVVQAKGGGAYHHGRHKEHQQQQPPSTSGSISGSLPGTAATTTAKGESGVSITSRQTQQARMIVSLMGADMKALTAHWHAWKGGQVEPINWGPLLSCMHSLEDMVHSACLGERQERASSAEDATLEQELRSIRKNSREIVEGLIGATSVDEDGSASLPPWAAAELAEFGAQMDSIVKSKGENNRRGAQRRNVASTFSFCTNLGTLEREGAMFWFHSRQVIHSRIQIALSSFSQCIGNVSYSSSAEALVGGDEANLVRPIRERQLVEFICSKSPMSLSLVGGARDTLVSGRWAGRSGLPQCPAAAAIGGSSDPLNGSIGFDVRRFVRHDGDEERRVVVTVRLYNVTGTPLQHGIRFDLTVNHWPALLDGGEKDTSQVSADVMSCLSPRRGNAVMAHSRPAVLSSLDYSPLASLTATHKAEVASGSCVTWEVVLEQWHAPGDIELNLSVSVREVQTETNKLRWVNHPGSTSRGGKSSLVDVTEDGEAVDDAMTDASASGAGASTEVEEVTEDDDESMDCVLVSDPVHVPCVVVLQPCPLVFFGGWSSLQDRQAALDTFCFLWSNMEFRVDGIPLIRSNVDVESENVEGSEIETRSAGRAALQLAKESLLFVPPDKIDDENKQVDVSRDASGWAFLSWSGDRVLCKLEGDNEGTGRGSIAEPCSLSVRGDNSPLLISLIGSQSARQRFVTDLTEGKWKSCEGFSL